ncbi:hypothetical protein [Marinimicrobium locisalis]|uniref:hypothetical protein n=1 Tax=Marinimicrobium locisalis TaxID=546022 RepID=UPI0032218A0E
MHVSLLTLANPSPESSFFRPRAFETAIAQLMAYYFEEDLSRSGTEQDWFVPTNWEPLDRFPCIAARFDAIQNTKLGLFDRRRYCYLPLSDEHLLEVVLPTQRYPVYLSLEGEPESDVNHWVSEEPMKKLANALLDSLEIRFSAEAERQQAKALEGLSADQRKLSETFAPLKWTTA